MQHLEGFGRIHAPDVNMLMTGGGFYINILNFIPTWGRWSNLTCAYFSIGLKLNHQPGWHVFFCSLVKWVDLFFRGRGAFWTRTPFPFGPSGDELGREKGGFWRWESLDGSRVAGHFESHDFNQKQPTGKKHCMFFFLGGGGGRKHNHELGIFLRIDLPETWNVSQTSPGVSNG